LSGNACQVGLFIVAVAGAFPTPLTPIMLLIINLLTDAMPAMAMAVEPEDPDITKRKIKKQEEGIVSQELLRGVVIQGIVSTTVLSIAFIYFLPQGIEIARTVGFTLFIFQKALRGITARSFTKSVFQYGLFTNALMNLAIPVALIVWFGIVYVAPHIFEVVPLPTQLALGLFGISFIFPLAEELTKKLNSSLLKR
jgi:Ca2+-transporting ATPase